MHIRTVFVALLLAASLLGCDSVTEQNAEAPLLITTDQSVYTLNDSTVIQVTVTNQSQRSYWYNTCNDATLHEVQGNDIGEGFGFVRCLCLCITEMAAGTSVNIELHLGGTDQSVLRKAVPYKARIPVYQNEPLLDELEEPLLLSSTFRFE